MFSKFKLKNSFFRNSFNRYSKKYGQLICINGFDHDGCLGLPYMNPHEIQSMQAPLIQFLNQQKKDYDYDYYMSSSNRQSIRLDCMNALHNQNNLAFPVVESLAALSGGYFDGLLLADITENRKPGYTIYCMKKFALERKINLSECVSDENLYELLKENQSGFFLSEDKINIAYAQTHHMASMHPDARIHFNIYDDLYDQVLRELITFYSKNAALLPFNIKLNLYFFNSTNNEYNNISTGTPELIHTIYGDGIIDTSYYHTIKIMEKIAKEHEGEVTKYHMNRYITHAMIHDLRNADMKYYLS